MKKIELVLDVANLLLCYEEQEFKLSPQLYKILYQFFLAVKKFESGHPSYADGPLALYDYIPGSTATIKVYMVAIKKMLPSDSYKNVSKVGYRLSCDWRWTFKY